MKALSLTQPWATLVAIGAKRIETRSWGTSYRGPLAIHASKGFPKWAQETCWEEPFRHALVSGGEAVAEPKGSLPLGAVIATCRLAHCKFIRDPGMMSTRDWKIPTSEEHEYFFGDYTPGRFAWFLDDVQALPEPIPAKGALGLWEWEPPRELLPGCTNGLPG